LDDGRRASPGGVIAEAATLTTVLRVPLSVLDLAPIGEGEPVGQALQGTVRLARRAEELGYLRVWYAEHHNIGTIASSATTVLIAHVAAHTERSASAPAG
jgi:hypothetical protein